MRIFTSEFFTNAPIFYMLALLVSTTHPWVPAPLYELLHCFHATLIPLCSHVSLLYSNTLALTLEAMVV